MRAARGGAPPAQRPLNRGGAPPAQRPLNLLLHSLHVVPALRLRDSLVQDLRVQIDGALDEVDQLAKQVLARVEALSKDACRKPREEPLPERQLREPLRRHAQLRREDLAPLRAADLVEHELQRLGAPLRAAHLTQRRLGCRGARGLPRHRLRAPLELQGVQLRVQPEDRQHYREVVALVRHVALKHAQHRHQPLAVELAEAPAVVLCGRAPHRACALAQHVAQLLAAAPHPALVRLHVAHLARVRVNSGRRANHKGVCSRAVAGDGLHGQLLEEGLGLGDRGQVHPHLHVGLLPARVGDDTPQRRGHHSVLHSERVGRAKGEPLVREKDDVFVGELPRRVVKEQLALGTQRLVLAKGPHPQKGARRQQHARVVEPVYAADRLEHLLGRDLAPLEIAHAEARAVGESHEEEEQRAEDGGEKDNEAALLPPLRLALPLAREQGVLGRRGGPVSKEEGRGLDRFPVHRRSFAGQYLADPRVQPLARGWLGRGWPGRGWLGRAISRRLRKKAGEGEDEPRSGPVPPGVEGDRPGCAVEAHPCERAKDVCAMVRVVARAHAHGEPGDGVVREGGVLSGRRREDGGRDVEDASGAGAGAIVGSEAAPHSSKPPEAAGGHRVGLKGEHAGHQASRLWVGA
mmetsp:Transcript_2233/g.6893  ORF Transcript_2233/g.6893 Transcript_2233/m.6893 type:complete len:634 (+) Transcript_2233:700-2601(+)